MVSHRFSLALSCALLMCNGVNAGTDTTAGPPPTTYNYYVSPNGSDTGPGSKEQPFNVVFRIGQAAIHLWHDAKDLLIINNTVSSSVFGIIVGGGDFYQDDSGANNVHVHNNIVFDNTYGISEQGKTGAANTYYNNLVHQNDNYDWSLQNGLQHHDTVSADPQFVDYTAPKPDFHLTGSSPAIGHGLATYAPSTDFDGKPRNQTTGYDIDAYQH